MKVDLFTLRIGGGKSFYARVDGGELMTVVDAFCVLDSGPLPIAVGMCSIAAQMQFDRAEAGARQIRISFLDDAGKLALPALETALDVKIPDHADSVTVPFAFMMKLLSFPAFGQYAVTLAVDGRTEATTSVYVRQKA